MNSIISQINKLKKSPIKKIIDSRLQEFQSFKNKNNKALFNELCFCLLTANTSAELGIRIQNEMKNQFHSLPQTKLAARLKELRYRFPNVRSNYIAEAQQHKNNIKTILKQHNNEHNLRNWFAKNIKGLGMKEASHFLRNIGYQNLAIIDFHIIDILADNNIITRPKTLTPKKYLEIESTLLNIGKKAKLNMAELDLYLWYLETGKILK
ncbi:N-glycosylase/DNA lyase [Nanoarchaeota archaeon]